MVRLVVGLGNPGQRYRGTRHNVGFEVLDRVADLLGGAQWRERGEAVLATGLTPEGTEVFLAKPLTYMNLSGKILEDFRNHPWYGPGAVLACYDDIDLPLGQVRVRLKGSAGGHKGMLSLLQALGSESVPRVRLGVGPVPPGEDAAEFVLERFTRDERRVVEEGLERAAQAVRAALLDGVEGAMNRFNARPDRPAGKEPA